MNPRDDYRAEDQVGSGRRANSDVNGNTKAVSQRPAAKEHVKTGKCLNVTPTYRLNKIVWGPAPSGSMADEMQAALPVFFISFLPLSKSHDLPSSHHTPPYF